MAKHLLKIKSEYFKKILRKEKRAEFRHNDRNFLCTDILILQEIKLTCGSRHGGEYMGNNFTRYCANDFTNSNHESLAFALKDINDMQGNPITVSNSLEAKELYADLGFIIHEIEAPRTIAANGNRKPAKEIIAVLNGGAQ